MLRNMDCTFPVSASEWENGEYEAKNIHIFKKELQNYVVYYVVRGTPQYFLFLGMIPIFLLQKAFNKIFSETLFLIKFLNLVFKALLKV